MALTTTADASSSGDLITYAVMGGGGLLFTIIFFAFLIRLYRRASKETAFVRTGLGGERVVMNGGALVFPVFHETMPVNMNTLVLPVVRRDSEALITLDRLRIDVKAEFYVRVRPDAGAAGTAERRELGEWLQHRIKTLVGVSTSIEVLPPDSIERTLTGKARRVQDLRKS